MRPSQRTALTVLGLLAVATFAIWFFAPGVSALWWAVLPPGPTPPPPTILAPTGQPPSGPGGLAAWANYEGGLLQPAGSGFLLRLPEGRVVGVIAAHSVALGDAGLRLQSIAFAIPDAAGNAIEFDQLLPPPGQARTGADMTVDYIFLAAATALPEALALEADPRGGPQPGERVTVYNGAGDGQARAGTVLSAEAQAVWVVMDEAFEPDGLSGSPLVSAHTGQVVGMAIAAARRGGRLTLGFHPIGSLVRLAGARQAATPLAAYTP